MPRVLAFVGGLVCLVLSYHEATRTWGGSLPRAAVLLVGATVLLSCALAARRRDT